MTEVVPDAAGNVVLVRRPNGQAPAQKNETPKPAAKAPPIATKYTPAVAAATAAPLVAAVEPPAPPPPPPPVVSTAAPLQPAKGEPIFEQPRMGSKDSLLPKKENEKEKDKEKEKKHETDGKWYYANFEPYWVVTLILVIIGTLMCPVLGAIGLVFAILAKLNGVSPSEKDPRLKIAEGCNKCACNLGVGAIIAGFIIIGTLVAVLIFLFVSKASTIVQGTV